MTVEHSAIRLFRVGDLVRPTKYFKQQFPNAAFVSGTVVGFSSDGKLMRVKRHGVADAERFTTDFWRLARPRTVKVDYVYEPKRGDVKRAYEKARKRELAQHGDTE